jgi:hypothetical protein
VESQDKPLGVLGEGLREGMVEEIGMIAGADRE